MTLRRGITHDGCELSRCICLTGHVSFFPFTRAIQVDGYYIIETKVAEMKLDRANVVEAV